MSRYEHILIPALMGFVATAWLIHIHHARKRRKPVRDRLTGMRALRGARSLRQ